MSTFHAVVWMDHSEAHVVMFDREHMEAQRIRSRSHHGAHQTAVAGAIVDSVSADHPTDAQLVAMARQYFKKFDAMAADPSMA